MLIATGSKRKVDLKTTKCDKNKPRNDKLPLVSSCINIIKCIRKSKQRNAFASHYSYQSMRDNEIMLAFGISPSNSRCVFFPRARSTLAPSASPPIVVVVHQCRPSLQRSRRQRATSSWMRAQWCSQSTTRYIFFTNQSW